MPVYRFVEEPSGFRIECALGHTVRVGVEPWFLVVGGDAGRSASIPLGDVDVASVRVADALQAACAAPEPRARVPAAVGAPAMRNIVRHLLAHRARVLAVANPSVVEMCRAVSAVTGGLPRLVFVPELYGSRWVVQDALRYRAAAVAVGFVESLLRPSGVPGRGVDPTEVPGLVAALARWRGLFSPTGEPYRSLDRTLMNLPVGFPGEPLCALRRVRLERPITNGIELAALLIGAEAYAQRGRSELFANHGRILQHAAAREIAEAVARVAAHTGRRLSPRRSADLRFVMQILADYPRPHRGRLAGLVEGALRWHEAWAGVPEEIRAHGGPETPTARPPVPLPEIEGIEFLATLGAVVEEAERMEHCMAHYAGPAVAGDCYLFRIVWRGERASVEVDSQGRVRQACGPRNQENAAARWGARRLRAWGGPLRPGWEAEAVRAQLRRLRRAAAREEDARQLCLWPR